MLLADTGPLVAVANDRDQHLERCRTLLETHRGPVVVRAPVIVEVCQLLASRRGTKAAKEPIPGLFGDDDNVAIGRSGSASADILIDSGH